jgi:hypothetical protein
LKGSPEEVPGKHKPKALVVISSAKVQPLAEPVAHPGISTEFFLVELAAVLKELEDEYGCGCTAETFGTIAPVL